MNAEDKFPVKKKPEAKCRDEAASYVELTQDALPES
jgi:hypothetical protein